MGQSCVCCREVHWDGVVCAARQNLRLLADLLTNAPGYGDLSPGGSKLEEGRVCVFLRVTLDS